MHVGQHQNHSFSFNTSLIRSFSDAMSLLQSESLVQGCEHATISVANGGRITTFLALDASSYNDQMHTSVTRNMAVPSSSPGKQNADPNANGHKTEQLEDFRGGNNDDQLADFSAYWDYEQQDHPETPARTSKTVDALLDTDAFVLDGERFYDAVAVEGEDAFTMVDESTGFAYWGLQVDNETRMVYYFNHSRPEEMQWLPPANLIHPNTREVLLWDASAQWFYFYNPQTNESRWLDGKGSCSQVQQQDDDP